MQPNTMQPNTQFLILQKKYQINLAQTQFSGPGRFRPDPFNHRLHLPGLQAQKTWAWAGKAPRPAGLRRPDRRPARASRWIKSNGRRSSPGRIKNGARPRPPNPNFIFLLPFSLFTPATRASEARATAASGPERIVGAEGGHGAAELRSPEVRAVNACAQLRRAALVGALRHPSTVPRSGVAATAVSGSG